MSQLSQPRADLPPDLAARLPPRLPPPEIDPDRLDVDSLKVIARLRRHGHAAYLVGGCVRDVLVGVRPKDWDVATSAHPEEIREIFRNSRLIGRRFRLAHVFYPGGRFVEVATFRSAPVPDVEADGEGDLLLVDDNAFGSAEEDAKRRDFTVNGLFYDVQEGRVLDYVGGREDLVARRIRTIGDPEIRLREDPVRGLRAARIAAKLGFSLDNPTFDAMQRHAGELPRCAAARVLDETLKILRCGASREAFETLRRAGLLRVLVPPVDEVLSRGGPETADDFFRRLGALDAALAEGGTAVTDAVMLATLLSFLPLHDEVEAEEPGEGAEGAEAGEGVVEEPLEDEGEGPPNASEVLAQMSQTARLPRRVADRVRSIVAAQRFLLAPPRRRRRRGGGARFVHAPHFPEALALLDILVRATGKHVEALARWRRRAAEAAQSLAAPADAAEEQAPGADASAPAQAPTAEAETEGGARAGEGPGRRKRHRGGRRHRRAGGREAGEPGSAPDGSAEALPASGSAPAEPGPAGSSGEGGPRSGQA